jgi:hypothetical protein
MRYSMRKATKYHIGNKEKRKEERKDKNKKIELLYMQGSNPLRLTLLGEPNCKFHQIKGEKAKKS